MACWFRMFHTISLQGHVSERRDAPSKPQIHKTRNIGQVKVTGIQTFSRLSCISMFIFFHIRLLCKQGTWQRLPTCGVHWYTLSGICIQLRAESIRNKHPEIGGCRESAISNFFDPSFLHATIHRCKKIGSSRQPVPNASQPWTRTLLTRSRGSLTSMT